MDNTAEKIVPLKPEMDAPEEPTLKDTAQGNSQDATDDLSTHDAEQAATEEAAEDAAPQPAPQKAQSDMGRMALVVSLMLVLIMAVSYFFLARDIKGLTGDVQALGAMRTEVDDMNSKIGAVELRMAALESLPEQTRRLVLRAMIQEMASKAAFLAKDMGSEAEAAKMEEAITLLRQVEQGMAQ